MCVSKFCIPTPLITSLDSSHPLNSCKQFIYHQLLIILNRGSDDPDPIKGLIFLYPTINSIKSLLSQKHPQFQEAPPYKEMHTMQLILQGMQPPIARHKMHSLTKMHACLIKLNVIKRRSIHSGFHSNHAVESSPTLECNHYQNYINHHPHFSLLYFFYHLQPASR